MSDQIAVLEAVDIAAADLVPSSSGAADHLDPQRCAAQALTLLRDAAGESMRLSSFSLEMGAADLAAEDVISIHVATDKRTHAIAFLSLEARLATAVAFTARSVFSVR
jgi:hypothetical protein